MVGAVHSHAPSARSRVTARTRPRLAGRSRAFGLLAAAAAANYPGQEMHGRYGQQHTQGGAEVADLQEAHIIMSGASMPRYGNITYSTGAMLARRLSHAEDETDSRY